MSSDGMRFDYVKVSWELEYDRAFELGQEWYGVFGQEQVNQPDRKCSNVRSVRKGQGGKFLYVFEAWGEAANKVYQLDFKKWSGHIERMDVRCDEVITRAGIDMMYGHLRENKSGNKNVQLFDSKANSKRNGRSTGGYGLAIGSHKSDLRTSFYVRGFEQGACEFQVQGAKIRNYIEIEQMMKRENPERGDNMCWNGIKYICYANGWADTRSVFGLNQDAILKLADGTATDDDPTEKKLARIDEILNSLDLDGITAVLESVQMRLI